MISDIFCKIINKELPAKFVYEDEEFVAFEDINPQAPIHILIVPKKHIEQIHLAAQKDIELFGKMIFLAGKIAKILKIEQKGYRLILNQGPDAGQVINHLHLHLVAGKKLGAKIVKINS